MPLVKICLCDEDNGYTEDVEDNACNRKHLMPFHFQTKSTDVHFWHYQHLFLRNERFAKYDQSIHSVSW